jgi:Arc/MetJ-type ribon-helix-helix transcriptional regulator
MTFTLNPEFQKFVDDQVRAGRYASPREVVEDALLRLMRAGPQPAGQGSEGSEGSEEGEEIDDEAFAALRRSDEQVRRGEGLSIDEVRERFRRGGVDLRPPPQRPGSP